MPKRVSKDTVQQTTSLYRKHLCFDDRQMNAGEFEVMGDLAMLVFAQNWSL